MQAGARYQGYH